MPGNLRLTFDTSRTARSYVPLLPHCCSPRVDTSPVAVRHEWKDRTVRRQTLCLSILDPQTSINLTPRYHTIKITIRLELTDEEYGTDVPKDSCATALFYHTQTGPYEFSINDQLSGRASRDAAERDASPTDQSPNDNSTRKGLSHSSRSPLWNSISQLSHTSGPNTPSP